MDNLKPRECLAALVLALAGCGGGDPEGVILRVEPLTWHGPGPVTMCSEVAPPGPAAWRIVEVRVRLHGPAGRVFLRPGDEGTRACFVLADRTDVLGGEVEVAPVGDAITEEAE